MDLPAPHRPVTTTTECARRSSARSSTSRAGVGATGGGAELSFGGAARAERAARRARRALREASVRRAAGRARALRRTRAPGGDPPGAGARCARRSRGCELMLRPGRTGQARPRASARRGSRGACPRGRGGRTRRPAARAASSTTRSRRLRSRIAVTPKRSLMLRMPSPRTSMWWRSRSRRLAEHHAGRAVVALDHVVGDQAVAAHHELERALALADAALAEQEHADLEHVDEHAVDARARREPFVEQRVEARDGRRRALRADDQRRAGALRLGDERRAADRPRGSRDTSDSAEREQELRAASSAPRRIERLEVAELGLARGSACASATTPCRCPTSASPDFWMRGWRISRGEAGRARDQPHVQTERRIVEQLAHREPAAAPATAGSATLIAHLAAASWALR